ncbi:MAG TPA: NAD(P)H-hydrate dehydratase [Methylibium sp.]|nr:NAD(P)H-hydrate dehydratase [Methylibium sp.]
MPVIVDGPCATPGGSAWPLHDADATRRIEAAASAALPPHALMQRAGLAVARLALAVAPHAGRIQVLAGPGNNGGDGLLAARHLKCAGRDVEVWLAPTHRARPTDAAMALQQARDAGVAIGDALPGAPAELCMDACLGVGLHHAPQGALAEAIRHANRHDAPVLAVDLPSGLDGDTGQPLDADGTIRARWTLALLSLKPGLFTGAGRAFAGQAWFDDLGIDACALAPGCAGLVTETRSLWPHRLAHDHKGRFGDVWIVGGAPGMRGAAWLAARAALAAGAGRVMVVPLGGAGDDGFDVQHPELMLRTVETLTATPSPLALATVVCGCGGGTEVRAVLPSLIAHAGRLVLDADALNAIAADRSIADGLSRRAARGQATVLTPHPLEAARLLGTDAAAVQRDRLAAARRLADGAPGWVVLKGSGSVVASPAGQAWINGSGNPALATAGSGDVLAGWLGGLWSQGLDAGDAARLATHTHGTAADGWAASQAIAGPLEASRLIERLRALRVRAVSA